MRERGAEQSPRADIYLKIRVFSAVYPNFGFRPLPSASAAPRGLPPAVRNHLRIYISGRGRAKYVAAESGAEVSDPIFT